MHPCVIGFWVKCRQGKSKAKQSHSVCSQVRSTNDRQFQAMLQDSNPGQRQYHGHYRKMYLPFFTRILANFCFSNTSLNDDNFRKYFLNSQTSQNTDNRKSWQHSRWHLSRDTGFGSQTVYKSLITTIGPSLLVVNQTATKYRQFYSTIMTFIPSHCKHTPKWLLSQWH